jgi:transketolase
MRDAFIEALFDRAAHDRRIMLLVGDLGFGVVTRFKTELPDQFVNVGVAEQNMAGLAAGLALSGRIVFTYSIANFPTIRCLEQIRNDICYHDCDVKIVAVGGGLAYGSLGMSHHATEDIAVMRALPNMTVLAPNDPFEAAAATRATVATPGPCYLRLGRSGEPLVHKTPPAFEIGRAIETRGGKDITLIATGGLLREVSDAAECLASAGVSVRILSMPTIKPLDRDAVLSAARETWAIFTVEEHSIIGGLGSAVAETLLEAEFRPRVFRRIGLPDAFTSVIGDRTFLREMHGLSASGIAQQVETALVAAGRVNVA